MNKTEDGKVTQTVEQFAEEGVRQASILTRHGRILEMNGESYSLKQFRARQVDGKA